MSLKQEQQAQQTDDALYRADVKQGIVVSQGMRPGCRQKTRSSEEQDKKLGERKPALLPGQLLQSASRVRQEARRGGGCSRNTLPAGAMAPPKACTGDARSERHFTLTPSLKLIPM